MVNLGMVIRDIKEQPKKYWDLRALIVTKDSGYICGYCIQNLYVNRFDFSICGVTFLIFRGFTKKEKNIVLSCLDYKRFIEAKIDPTTGILNY